MRVLNSLLLLLIVSLSASALELLPVPDVSDPKSDCPVTFSIKGIDKDSGKFINQLGFYQSCIDREGMTYFLARTAFLLGILKATFIGVCVPEACTEVDVQKSLSNLYKKLDLKYQGIMVTNP